jgi:hypothetical protein
MSMMGQALKGASLEPRQGCNFNPALQTATGWKNRRVTRQTLRYEPQTERKNRSLENAPSGPSKRWRIGQLDPIAEALKFADHPGRATMLGPLADDWPSFLVTDS